MIRPGTRRHASLLLAVAFATTSVLVGCEESFDDDGAGGDAASGGTLAGKPTSGPDASSATGFGGGFQEEGTTVDVTVPVPPSVPAVRSIVEKLAAVSKFSVPPLIDSGAALFTNVPLIVPVPPLLVVSPVAL